MSRRDLTIDDAVRLLHEALEAELPRVRAAGFRAGALVRVWVENTDGSEADARGFAIEGAPRPASSAPSGNACAHCGGVLQRTGACETCQNCGETTSCG